MKMNDNMLFALELALWRFVRLRREGADGSINWQCGSRLKPCSLCVETVEEQGCMWYSRGLPPELEAALAITEATMRYVQVERAGFHWYSGMGYRAESKLEFYRACTKVTLGATLWEYWAVLVRHPSWWRWLPVLPWAPGRIK